MEIIERLVNIIQHRQGDRMIIDREDCGYLLEMLKNNEIALQLAVCYGRGIENAQEQLKLPDDKRKEPNVIIEHLAAYKVKLDNDSAFRQQQFNRARNPVII